MIKSYLWQGKSYSKAELVHYLRQQSEQTNSEFEKEIFEFALSWLNEKQNVFFVKTSGSTGIPKEIALERKHMEASAQATGSYLNLQPGQSCLLVLPASFIAGKMMIVRALELGLDFYFEPPKIDVLSQIQGNYDFVALIPPQILHVLKLNEWEKLNQFSKIIVGGAALNDGYNELFQQLEASVFSTYGMTETITHVAMRPLNGLLKSNFFHCLPGITVSLNQEKCLVIHSDRLPQKTIETNDLANILSDNSFEILGRTDHVINSGGLKISPESWEEKIKAYLPFEILLSYVDDEFLGQKLVLLVEAPSDSRTTETIRALIDQHFSAKYSPKHMLYLPQLFRTPNGKPDRKACQNWLCDQKL